MSGFAIFTLVLVLLFASSYWLTCSLSQFFYFVTNSQKWTVMVIALLFFPGVLIHELAHFLMASLLFVPTGEIEFVPKLTGNKVKLGSVQIARTDPFRRALIGIAPVLVGGGLLLWALYFMTTHTFTSSTVDLLLLTASFYAVFELSNTMFSSQRDVEGTVELILAIGVIALALYFAGVRLPDAVVSIFNSTQLRAFLLTASKLLLIPLTLNLLAVGLSKLFGRKLKAKV